MYTKIDLTKNEVINELNFLIDNDNDNNNKHKLNRTTLHEKDLKIPLQFYVDLFNKIINLYLDFFNDNKVKKLISIDGVYNNRNVFNTKGFLETSMNFGFFDITPFYKKMGHFLRIFLYKFLCF